MVFDDDGTATQGFSLGGAGEQTALEVGLGPADDLYVAGFNGAPAAGGTIPCDGGMAVTSASADAFVAHLAMNGSCLGVVGFGGTAAPHDLWVGGDQVVVVGAHTSALTNFEIPLNGIQDGFVLALDTALVKTWGYPVGTVEVAEDAVVDVAPHPDGGILIGGAFGGTAAIGGITKTAVGTADGFVAHLDVASGAADWAEIFGGDGYEAVTSVDAQASGNLVISGHGTSIEMDFGGSLLTGRGGDYDVFLFKLGALRNHLWSYRFGDAEQQVLPGAQALMPDGSIALGILLRGEVDFGLQQHEALMQTASDYRDIVVVTFEP
jgi:hypothetical protein